MTDNDHEPEPTNEEKEADDMSAATVTAPVAPRNGTAAARVIAALNEAANPLTVEQISKLTDVKPATLERALRKMVTDRQVTKGTNGDEPTYAIPAARKTKGEIALQVLTFLEEHPGEDLSPYKIAQGIERFPGSVAWTCSAMARRGELVQIGEKPVTYRLP